MAMEQLKIAIFGACREGIDCLRTIRGSRITNNDEFIFLDNDIRMIGQKLEDCPIFNAEHVSRLNLDLIVIAVIDTHKVKQQLLNAGYTGSVKAFYGEQYFSENVRQVGMATIGRYSYYKPSTILYNAKIGNYCHIGADCRLGLIGHDSAAITTYPLRLKSLDHGYVIRDEAPRRLKPLIVEDDVYIGEGVSIMAGITIGRGAIIGSKSFVTSDVEPYTVVGGVPARKISERLKPEVRDQLDRSYWTKEDISEAIQILEELEQENVHK